MAGIQGTNIVAPVVPLDTADVHPTHEAQYGKGGFRSVETTSARDAIPAPRREAGMLVYVAGTGTTWRLGSDLATWTEDGGGGGATGPTGPASTVTGPTGATGPAGTTTWSGITGTPATFPPSAHTHAIGDTTGLQAALDLKATIESPQFTNFLDAARFTDDASTVTSISGGFVTTRRVTFATDATGVFQTTAFTGTLKTKLDGIATGATANATDAQLRDRSTHTGTQAAGTITGLAASATTDTTNAANITSGTIAAARLPLSTTAQALAGTNTATAVTPAAMHLSRRGSGRAKFWEVFNDFTFDFSGYAAGSDGCVFSSQSSGGGSGIDVLTNQSSAFTRPTAGILTAYTGTTSTGRGGFDSFQSRPHRFDTGTTTYEALIYIPSLATATEDYVLRIGYCQGNAFSNDVVCWEYDRAASNNWRGVCGFNATYSRVDSGVAVAATSWIKLGVAWTSSLATFFINDSSVGTISANIRADGATRIGAHIIKTAGTTSRSFLVDYIYARHDFTNDRTHG